MKAAQKRCYFGFHVLARRMMIFLRIAFAGNFSQKRSFSTSFFSRKVIKIYVMFPFYIVIHIFEMLSYHVYKGGRTGPRFSWLHSQSHRRPCVAFRFYQRFANQDGGIPKYALCVTSRAHPLLDSRYPRNVWDG